MTHVYRTARVLVEALSQCSRWIEGAGICESVILALLLTAWLLWRSKASSLSSSVVDRVSDVIYCGPITSPMSFTPLGRWVSVFHWPADCRLPYWTTGLLDHRTTGPLPTVLKSLSNVTMPAPSPLPTKLYKILPSAPPSPLPERLPLSPLDHNDGYIHLSTAEQVPGTADKFFGDASELWLLKIKYDVLAAGTDGNGQVHADNKAEVKWEDVGRGCFAHFYGADLGSGNVESVHKVEKKGTWVDSLSLEW